MKSISKFGLSKVDCSRGAPMGRSDTVDTPALPFRMHLVYVPFVDGCYDPGGAYWGAPANLYHAWGDVPCAPGESQLDTQEVFVRANSRDEAKALVRESFPFASFWR